MASPSKQKLNNKTYLISVPKNYNSSDEIRLQCRHFTPSNAPKSSGTTCIILVHPYPPLGGDFNNNVILDLYRRLAQQNKFQVLAINLRGAGGSDGRVSWTGETEVCDVKCIMRFLIDGGHISGKNDRKVENFILCGYSYGSMILSSILADEDLCPRVKLFISISFPLSVTWFLSMFNSTAYLSALSKAETVSKLFVIGNRDQFTRVSKLSHFIENECRSHLTNSTAKLVDFEKADHFWIGYEKELSECIMNFISEKIGFR